MTLGTNDISRTATIPGQMLYRLIQKVYVLLDDYDRKTLERFELNSSQYRTLIFLGEKGGERLTTISNRLLLSKSSITRIIDDLEDREWVKRIPDPEDRRALRVVLTPNGARRRQQIINEHREAMDDIFQQFSLEEREELDRLLGKLFVYLQEGLDGNLLREQKRQSISD